MKKNRARKSGNKMKQSSKEEKEKIKLIKFKSGRMENRGRENLLKKRKKKKNQRNWDRGKIDKHM